MKKIDTLIEIHHPIQGNINNNIGSKKHLRIKCTSTSECLQTRECISSHTRSRTSRGHLLINKGISSRTGRGHLPINKCISSRLRRCTTHSTHSKRRSHYKCSNSNNSTQHFTEAIKLCVANPFSLA